MLQRYLPHPSMRFTSVWRRHFLVWRKLAIPSLLGSLADPLIFLFGLGYGLGGMLGTLDGQPYISFLAGGMVCYATLNSASFEVLYAGFSRMHVQKTWDAILNTPVTLDDIVLAEAVWAASKSLLAGTAIITVAACAGLAHGWTLLAIPPVVFLAGLCFACLGLIVTALAPNFDFFMYYFTLCVTPMTLISGVFFPSRQLPPALQGLATLSPLSHLTDLVRPMLQARWPGDALVHLGVLGALASLAYIAANLLMRRRLLE